MKVNFRGKKIDIKNEKDKKSEFLAHWNGYVIEINPYETHYYSNGRQKLKYEGYCCNPVEEIICDNTSSDTISKSLQEIFDNIDGDINDLQIKYKELGEALKLLSESISN